METTTNDNFIPNDFNWKNYLKLNKDLPQGYNENDCISHYCKYGKKESRIYSITSLPKDFNWKMYKFLNDDLPTDYKKDDYILHYLRFGKNEGRNYKLMLSKLKSMDLFYYRKKNDEINEINFMENVSINDNFNSGSVIFTDNKDDCHDYLENNYLIGTKLFNNILDSRFLQYKIDNNVLNIINDFMLIIDFNNGGGGTTFFLNTIVSKYKNYQTFVIARNVNGLLHLNINEEYELLNKYTCDESLKFLSVYKPKIKKIFVNHTCGHFDMFLNKLFTMNKEIITVTHDYSLLTSISQPLYHEIKKNIMQNPPKINHNKYDTIISQNEINTHVFKDIKYICELPDFKYSDTIIHNNDTSKIVIGIIGNINNLKGRKIFKQILKYFEQFKKFEFVVIGYVEIKDFTNQYCYNNIDEFNELLLKIKPNALLELSLWPETYSYTLTLAMLTKLPIFCLKKKFISVVENRLKNYNKVFYFSTINELQDLINFNTQKFLCTIKPFIYYNKFWNELFITNKTKMESKNTNKNNFNIKPYFIYFPQFHVIKENNINFYENYTDIINLKKFNLSNENKVDEPLLSYLNIENLEDYNLDNSIIIQKQIDLLDYYNFEGLAIYYYWFSHNTVTNKNMIMENVINKFFNKSLDLKKQKVFFIWANEDWSNNDAFGNNINIIKNVYNDLFFEKNADNLLQYFKDDNYLKIDNKPVFFIYHNHLITNNLLNTFYKILNDKCIQNNFSGIHFVLNSFVNKSTDFQNFYINFNYKKTDSIFYDEKKKQLFLDYKKYTDDFNVSKNTIQTIVYDFNNKARLFEPNKLNKSTICINSTEFDKIKFTQKIINSYNRKKKSNIENILLINSFNEWGENMAIEPSFKYEYYYMNLLKQSLEIL